MATLSYTSLNSFNTGNPNSNPSSSNSNVPILNSDIRISNTDEINNTSLNRLLPFSLEITEKIIAFAYYLDSPHIVSNNNHIDEDDNLKISVPNTAKNITKGRYAHLSNLMLVNSGFYFLCLTYQYKYCDFIRSFSFHKFLLNLLNSNELGNYVQTLDFQEFTAVGLGKSKESIFKIPNLTSSTLLTCLNLCQKNLHTLLLNESIDTDINLEILDFIFNDLKNLKSLDFCGVSNDDLIKYFHNLTIRSELTNLEKLSFHECLTLPTLTYSKIFPFTPNLKRLDLSHTQVTLKTLDQFLSKNVRLTHLSLRKCSHLGTFTEFIKFLKHPAICGGDEDYEINHDDDNDDNDDEVNQASTGHLRWLNIQQCFSSDILTSDRLDAILDILVSGATNLRYLNLNGFANLNGDHLRKISENFPNLESLNISDIDLNLSDPNDLNILKQLNLLKNLRFLDVSSKIWNFEKLKNLISTIELNSMEAFEIKPYLSDNLSHLLLFNRSYNIDDVEYWRVYNNKGTSRRCWIHRVKSEKDSKLIDNYETEQAGGRLMEWDIHNGNVILNKVKRANWLGLASVKINCCENIDYSLEDEDFGNDLCVRGLYKYYSLKV